MKTSVFRARPTCVLAGLLAICGGIVIAAQAPTLTAPAGQCCVWPPKGSCRPPSRRLTPRTTIQIQPGQYRLSRTLLLANADHVHAHGCDRQPRRRRVVWRRRC